MHLALQRKLFKSIKEGEENETPWARNTAKFRRENSKTPLVKLQAYE